MKKIVIAVLVVLLVGGVYVTLKNTVCGTFTFPCMRKNPAEAAFSEMEREALSGGLIKTTFRSAPAVGANLEVVIISKDIMVLGGTEKAGRKTIVTFEPMKETTKV